jgi:murein DD-endopeptidase MepM/ murein hydrolase activator NlpD
MACALALAITACRGPAPAVAPPLASLDVIATTPFAQPRHDKAKVAPKPSWPMPLGLSTPVTATRELMPKSAPLPNGMFNPMPGGVMAGYRADTGLDIAGHYLPVYAIAAGSLDYSESGHTLWTGRGDTANTVRIELDHPIPWGERRITHAWYAHLSALSFHQAEGARPRLRVEAGEQLGVSGVANGSPHLHLGLLLDGVVSQRWGSYLLEDDVREVLGGWRTRQRLPQ